MVEIPEDILLKIVNKETYQAYKDAGEKYKPDTAEKLHYIFFQRCGILTDRHSEKIKKIQRVVNAIYRVRDTNDSDQKEYLLYNFHEYLDDIKGNKISWTKDIEGYHKVPNFHQEYDAQGRLYVTGIDSTKVIYDIPFSKEAVDKLRKMQKKDAKGARLYIGYVTDGHISDHYGTISYNDFVNPDFNDIYYSKVRAEIDRKVSTEMAKSKRPDPLQEIFRPVKQQQPEPQAAKEL